MRREGGGVGEEKGNGGKRIGGFGGRILCMMNTKVSRSYLLTIVILVVLLVMYVQTNLERANP